MDVNQDMKTGGDTQDIPVLPYAPRRQGSAPNLLGLLLFFCIGGSALSIVCGIRLWLVYLRDRGCWCGTPIATATSVLELVAVPTLIISLGSVVYCILRGKRASRVAWFLLSTLISMACLTLTMRYGIGSITRIVTG